MTLAYQPQNLTAEQADGNILLTWSGSLNATGYQIQRSVDGVNFTNLATTITAIQYVDSLPGIGIVYYYQVAATNLSGTSPYSSVVQMVAAPPSEMSLGELRLRSQQTADRVNSNFVTTSEWNAFLRLAMYELYDLLITSYEDLFASQIAFINTNGTIQNYPIPDGVTNYLGGTFGGISGTPAQALYKLAGMDLGINTSNNAWVTLLKFDFIERNKYVYPNSTSTIYGVYNMRYRLMGNFVNIIPTPAGNQQIRIWYSPKLPALLRDSDLTTLGYSGWLRYPIVRAAKYALDKEEGSDTSKLDQEIAFLKMRIEQTSQNRDAGVPDTISNTRTDPLYGGNGFASGGGGNAGWAFVPLCLFPGLMQNNIGNGSLIDPVLICQMLLGIKACFIFRSYYLRNHRSNFRSHIIFSKMSRFMRGCLPSLKHHISYIVFGGSKK